MGKLVFGVPMLAASVSKYTAYLLASAAAQCLSIASVIETEMILLLVCYHSVLDA
jgi:hypothetical protein